MTDDRQIRVAPLLSSLVWRSAPDKERVNEGNINAAQLHTVTFNVFKSSVATPHIPDYTAIIAGSTTTHDASYGDPSYQGLYYGPYMQVQSATASALSTLVATPSLNRKYRGGVGTALLDWINSSGNLTSADLTTPENTYVPTIRTSGLTGTGCFFRQPDSVHTSEQQPIHEQFATGTTNALRGILKSDKGTLLHVIGGFPREWTISGVTRAFWDLSRSATHRWIFSATTDDMALVRIEPLRPDAAKDKTDVYVFDPPVYASTHGQVELTAVLGIRGAHRYPVAFSFPGAGTPLDTPPSAFLSMQYTAEWLLGVHYKINTINAREMFEPALGAHGDRVREVYNASVDIDASALPFTETARDLVPRLRHLTDQLNKSKQDATEARAELAQLQTDLASVDASRAILEDQLDISQGDLANLERQFEIYRRSAETRLESATNERDKLQTDLGITTDALEKSTKRVAALVNQAQQQASRADALQIRIDKTQKRLRASEAERDELVKQIDEIKTETSELKTSMESDAREKATAHASQLTALQEQHATALAQTAEDLKTQIRTLADKHKQEAAELRAGLVKKYTESMQESNDAVRKVSEAEFSRAQEEFVKKSSESDAQLTKLRDRLAELEADLASAKVAINSEQERHAAEVAILRDELEKSIVEARESDDADAYIELARQLRLQLDVATRTIVELRTELSEKHALLPQSAPSESTNTTNATQALANRISQLTAERETIIRSINVLLGKFPAANKPLLDTSALSEITTQLSRATTLANELNSDLAGALALSEADQITAKNALDELAVAKVALNRAQQENTDLKNRISAQEKELEHLTKTITSYQTRIHDADARQATETGPLRDTITRLRNERGALEQKIATYEKRIDNELANFRSYLDTFSQTKDGMNDAFTSYLNGLEETSRDNLSGMHPLDIKSSNITADESIMNQLERKYMVPIRADRIFASVSSSYTPTARLARAGATYNTDRTLLPNTTTAPIVGTPAATSSPGAIEFARFISYSAADQSTVRYNFLLNDERALGYLYNTVIEPSERNRDRQLLILSTRHNQPSPLFTIDPPTGAVSIPPPENPPVHDKYTELKTAWTNRWSDQTKVPIFAMWRSSITSQFEPSDAIHIIHRPSGDNEDTPLYRHLPTNQAIVPDAGYFYLRGSELIGPPLVFTYNLKGANSQRICLSADIAATLHLSIHIERTTIGNIGKKWLLRALYILPAFQRQ